MSKNILEEVEYFNENKEKYYELDGLTREELLQTFIKVQINSSDDFLKVKETLTRIGIANRTKKELYQSCLLFHKKGEYMITHFKEMFAMDARNVDMEEADYFRRNHIARLLESWGLVKILNPEVMDFFGKTVPTSVYVIPYREKQEWTLKTKYSIGGTKVKNKGAKNNE